MSLNKTVLVSDAALEERISQIISDAGLGRPANSFFNDARTAESITPFAALRIGLQWQSVTKAFTFTTICSLGLMARRFHAEADPARIVLGAFQTAYSVIGDDLANIAPEFSGVAPKGVAGVHYIWWYDSIVRPLADTAGPELAAVAADLPAGVQALLKNMERLADSPLGAAVQLRVVEAIALDIAVAFRRIYAKVEVDGRRLYDGAGALAWIDSHIKAETVHAKSVSDDETGMTMMAVTEEERAEMLGLVMEYAANWAKALNDFAGALSADLTPAR